MRNLKNGLFTLFILLMCGFMNAQAFSGNGDKKLQIGLTPYGHGTGLVGTFDFGIHDILSLGVGGEFYFDDDHDHGHNHGHDSYFIYGRFNIHLGSLLKMPSEMDLYPGVDVGVLGDDFGIGGHLGFRYFFSNNLGLFVEVGNGGKIGLAFNL